MEESYETFEEELGPQRAGPPPQKPVHRRPEMYAKRKLTEDLAPQRLRAEARTLAREPSFSRTPSLHRALSIQNLSQMEKPWENVTLNRCLFVAITILVLTSGFQRLHEALRGQRAVEEDNVGLRVRRSGALRHRGQEPKPETTLWEVMFWWLPDLDDEDDEDEEDNEGDIQKVKTKRGGMARPPRGLRNKQLTDKKLMKRREGKLKDRRAKKNSDDKIREKEETEDPADAEEEEQEETEESGLKNKQSQERKVKKKTPKA